MFCSQSRGKLREALFDKVKCKLAGKVPSDFPLFKYDCQIYPIAMNSFDNFDS